jgi:hypothetical protein
VQSRHKSPRSWKGEGALSSFEYANPRAQSPRAQGFRAAASSQPIPFWRMAAIGCRTIYLDENS